MADEQPQQTTAVEQVAGTSAEPIIDVESKAIELLAQGKRSYFVREYEAAVTALEECVKLFDTKFGVEADECVEGYYYYGLTLFHLNRNETNILVDNPAGAQTEDEGDDEEGEEADAKPAAEGEEEEEAAVAEEEKSTAVIDKGDFEEDITHSPKAAEEATAAESTAGPAADGDMMVDDIDPNQPSTSSGVTDANRSAAVDDEEEEEEEGSNLEVAFEVLQMAKKIFTRQLQYKTDVHLYLAEAAQKLGEIFVEWENYDDALSEFQVALQIRQEKLQPDDRLIAESLFTVGLAFSSKNMIQPAEQHILKAIGVIEARIANLQTQLANPAVTEQDKQLIVAEIDEMQKLIPDMRFKLEDLANLVQAVDLVTETAKKDFLEDQQIQEKARQNLNKPVTNLTHLVKRKRDDDDDDIPSSKRLNNEDAAAHQHTNGNSQNGHQNGHQNGNATNGKHEIGESVEDVSMVE